jgi:hypothetical protein
MAAVAKETLYRLRPAVAFYVHNPKGVSFDVRLSRHDLNFYCHGPREMSVKVMDPDEKELFWYEFPDDGITVAADQAALAGWDHELWARAALWDAGCTSLTSFSALSDPRRIQSLPVAAKTFAIRAGKPGIYQVICCGCYDHWLGIEVSRGLKHGVLGHPDMLYGTGDQFAASYLYIPRTADSVEFWLIEPDGPRQRCLTVRDEAGKPLGQLTALGGKNEITVPVTQKDTVWNLEISKGGDYLLKVRHVPGILCPDPETARAIHAYTFELPNGKIVFSQLQRRAYEYLNRTIKPSDLLRPLPQFNAEEFVSSVPLDQVELLFGQSYMPAQGLYDVLNSLNGLVRKLGPNATMKDLTNQFGTHFILDNLALFYSEFPRGNPCFGNPDILRATIFGYLCVLFEYGPADVYRHDEMAYTGLHSQGFYLLWKAAQGLWMLKGALPPEARELLTEGVRRSADRLATVSDIELCLTNMYSSIPSGLYFAYLATGDERYRNLSLRHAYRLIDATYGPHYGQAPAGYYREHFALDAGYNSMTSYQLGMLYHLGKDERILESLRRDWRFIVHQVLREPDGSRIGPSDFASRTPSAFVDHQWGSPVRWVQHLIPEAGAFAGGEASGTDDAKRRASLVQSISNFNKWSESRELNSVARSWVGAYATCLWRVVRQPPQPGVLPIDEEQPFSRSFGDEFFCVKRPGYYVIVNAVQPVPSWMNPLFGGYLGFTGGAISAFRTPQHGTCLLGRMPNAYGVPFDAWQTQWFVNTIVGVREDGRVFTTGVSVPSNRFDVASGQLEVSGECRGAPILYKRTFDFADDRVRVRVSLRNSGRVRHVWMGMGRHQGEKVREFHEVFPYLEKGAVGFFKSDGTPIQPGEGKVNQVQAVQFASEQGSVYLIFSRPFDLTLHSGACDVGRGKKVRTLSIAVPAAPLIEEGAETYTVFAVPKSDGGEVAYGYTLMPFTGKPTAEETRAAIRSAANQ